MNERHTSERHSIEAATKRLLLALDALEAAIERRREADRAADKLAAQVQALSADRARLASDLDEVHAASRDLEETGRLVSTRVEIAIDLVRSVLDGADRHTETKPSNAKAPS